MTRILFGALTLALTALCGANAQAQVMSAATELQLHAGPGPAYPVVVVVAPQTGLNVQGCIPDYTWCDVATGPYRGWAYAGSINYMPPSGGATAPLLNWGRSAGVAVVPFALNNYWDQHYRDRRFYSERNRWAGPGGEPPRDGRGRGGEMRDERGRWNGEPPRDGRGRPWGGSPPAPDAQQPSQNP